MSNIILTRDAYEASDKNPNNHYLISDEANLYKGVDRIVKEFKKPSLLPAGYTQVEYIHSNRAGAIYTGVTTSGMSHLKTEYEYKPYKFLMMRHDFYAIPLGVNSGTTTYGVVSLGCTFYTSSSEYGSKKIVGIDLYSDYDSSDIFCMFSTPIETNDDNIFVSNWYKIEANYGLNTGGSIIKINDQSYSTSRLASRSLNKELTILNVYPNTENATVLTKTIKAWNGDTDELLLEYIPCIRDNDNAAGFYDLVSDSFKLPPSGAFEAGPIL